MLFPFFSGGGDTMDSASPAWITCPFQGSWALSHVGVSNWPLRLQPVALVCANSPLIYALAQGRGSAHAQSWWPRRQLSAARAAGGQRQRRWASVVLRLSCSSWALADAGRSVLGLKQVTPLKLEALGSSLWCPLNTSRFWSMATSLGLFLVSLCGTNPKPNEAKSLGSEHFFPPISHSNVEAKSTVHNLGVQI